MKTKNSFIFYRDRHSPAYYLSGLWSWYKEHRDKVRAMKEKKEELDRAMKEKEEEIAKIDKEMQEILKQSRKSFINKLYCYSYNRIKNSPSTDEQDKKLLFQDISNDLQFFDKQMSREFNNITGAIQNLYK